MDRYIGIDVHAQSCTMAVVSAAGKKLRTEVVETNGAALIEAVRSVAGERHICFEEGTQSAWLYELLEKLAEEIVVCMPEKRDGSKSDAIDALDLAQRLRRGDIARSVFKAPSTFIGLRERVRSYTMVTRDVVRAKNRLRAVFRARAIRVTADELYDSDNRPELIKKLPSDRRYLAEAIGRELDALQGLRKDFEAALLDESAKYPLVRRLMTAPAIGPIRAALIISIVISPHRFRTKKQFWGYCGLGIVLRTSADWVPENGRWIRAKVKKTRGLNKNRQPLLKDVFKGAAQHVINMRSQPLYKDYERALAAGTKPNLAKLTLARRIAAAVLAMWKNQEDYDPKKHESRTR